ncbi:MAG: cytochrome c peroxidase [Dokdonella sp.]
MREPCAPPASRMFSRVGAAVIFAALSSAAAAAQVVAPALTVASLGREIFLDPSLSASGRMACATCHDPAHAHASPNALAVQSGGANLDVAGFRSVPSLRYLNTAAFFFDKEGTPTAGFNHDGSAASLLDQAELPLLAAHEMANGDAATVAARLRMAAYADDFLRLFGNDAFDDAERALLRARVAIAAYEKSAPELHPFDSKYDYFLKGSVRLAPAELRGFALFNRKDKGNCAACHTSTRGSDGSPPLFTDYSYDNLGVPRNAQIPANANPAYFDLGLCAVNRSDGVLRRDLCGAFKVPTLRNVATRQAFFHNGLFKTLHDVVRFYVRRETNPEEFYPRDADGIVMKFDDLPRELVRNVNTLEVPYDRRPGQAPRLDDAEIDDLVAFLQALTDGYDPATNTADPARNVPLAR